MSQLISRNGQLPERHHYEERDTDAANDFLFFIQNAANQQRMRNTPEAYPDTAHCQQMESETVSSRRAAAVREDHEALQYKNDGRFYRLNHTLPRPKIQENIVDIRSQQRPSTEIPATTRRLNESYDIYRSFHAGQTTLEIMDNSSKHGIYDQERLWNQNMPNNNAYGYPQGLPPAYQKVTHRQENAPDSFLNSKMSSHIQMQRQTQQIRGKIHPINDSVKQYYDHQKRSYDQHLPMQRIPQEVCNYP